MFDIKQVPRPSGVRIISSAKLYYSELKRTLDELDLAVIEEIAEALVGCFERNKTVFLIGNGGSASTASHFACDLAKGTAGQSPSGMRFRAHALTDNVPTMTAWANDTDYREIFSEQLKNFATEGDVLLAISGSGNSMNILRAVETARERRLTVIGLTGFRGGKLKPLCNICCVVPSPNMQIIEDVHLSLSHSLYHILSHRLAGEKDMNKVVGAD